MQQGIRHAQVSTRHDGSGKVSVVFGPHYGLDIESDGKNTTFRLVATHHGISVDASVPGGEPGTGAGAYSRPVARLRSGLSEPENVSCWHG